MRSYNKPSLRRIRLDSDQAILQACMVGGAYFIIAGLSQCIDTPGGAPVGACTSGVRGVTITDMGRNIQTDATPS